MRKAYVSKAANVGGTLLNLTQREWLASVVILLKWFSGRNWVDKGFFIADLPRLFDAAHLPCAKNATWRDAEKKANQCFG